MQRNWIGKSSGARVRFAAETSAAEERSRSSPRGPTRCSAPLSWRSRADHPLAPELAADNPAWPLSPRVPARRHQRGRARDPGEARLRHRADAAAIRFGRTGRCRSSSPISCSWTMAPGPSSAARRTISAISNLPANTGCRCCRWSCRRARIPTTSRSATRPLSATACCSIPAFLDGLDVEAGKRRAIAELEARGSGSGETTLAAARLGRIAAALLGLPDPGHPLRCLRHRAGARREQLPVVLPEDVDFARPGNPLDHHPTWKHVACPQLRRACRAARPTRSTPLSRAPGTSPASARPDADDRAVRREAADYWLPVDQYIGGVEHAVLHLLYSRFYTRAMARLRLSRSGRAVRRHVHAGHDHAPDLPRRRPATGWSRARSSRDEAGDWIDASPTGSR